MNKLLRIPIELWKRIDKWLTVKGMKFTEFAKRAFDEFLTKEGF